MKVQSRKQKVEQVERNLAPDSTKGNHTWSCPVSLSLLLYVHFVWITVCIWNTGIVIANLSSLLLYFHFAPLLSTYGRTYTLPNKVREDYVALDGKTFSTLKRREDYTPRRRRKSWLNLYAAPPGHLDISVKPRIFPSPLQNSVVSPFRKKVVTCVVLQNQGTIYLTTKINLLLVPRIGGRRVTKLHGNINIVVDGKSLASWLETQLSSSSTI